MDQFQTVAIENFNLNPFQRIGKDWMLVTAEKEGKVNSLTASWGGIGVIWNKNAAFIFIRESRYTKEFIDSSDTFSLSFFDSEKDKEMLSYMGKVSGREEDKIKGANLTVNHKEHIPYFEEASMVLLCKKMCHQLLKADSFLLDTIDSQFYKDKDYHELYIGEIIEILSRYKFSILLIKKEDMLILNQKGLKSLCD
jgi:flavin reductase (DIM6/NTAB) family NADH-FMN oxidoreductase RutF